MQIHELNRSRRTDEGVWDVVKGVGGAAKTAVAQAVSPGAGTTQDFRASSAGITDPVKKLDAVKKNSQMVKLATQYADEWIKTQPASAPAQSAPASQPAPAGETPEQKRIRLQKAAQQNIDKTAVPVPAKPAAPTPADIRQAKQAQAAQAAQAQMSAVKEDTEVATPGTYNKKTGAAKLGGKTMTALSDLPPNVQQQIQAKQDLQQQTGRANPYMTPAAQQPTTPAPTAKTTAATTPAPAATTPAPTSTAPAKTANFGTGPKGYSNTATSVKTAPGQPAPQTATQPAPAKTANFAPQGAGYKAATQPTSVKYSGVPGTKPVANPGTAPAAAAPDYTNNFLEWANKKVAMRDPTTYKMLGLADAEGSELGPQLDDAKQAVKDAQGDPAKTKEAVKNYILTAMAALQLEASKNKVKAASPEAPAYGQQPAPAGQPGATGAAAAPAAGKITGAGAVALLTQAGLGPQVLGKAGEAIQRATGNKQLSKTGDSVIDTMLEGMGYTVS